MYSSIRKLTQLLATRLPLVVLLTFLSACEREPAKPVAEACMPECNDRCSGDDSCGGTCRCDADPACAKCAPHESCTAGQCICNPRCENNACGPDGCGGTCACPDDRVQNAEGEWVSRQNCNDTCAGAGFSCGELCGQKCGACEGGRTCELGQCGDSQTCSNGECTEGGTCTTCSTTLRLVDKRVVDGRVLEVTLAIEYSPADGEPRPRVADFRLKANKPVQILDAKLGPAIEKAGKSLYVDGATGNPWKVRGDGSFQFLAFAVGNSRTFEPGRALTLRVAVGSSEPVGFSLVRRSQVFAPPPADASLQATSYDQMLTVTP